MGAIGRQCSVINLNPANDHTSYTCSLDIRDLVTLEEIMSDDRLGPNGGVLYALEELENNMEWLENGLKELGDDYVLFDCPGQVELYTHHNSLRNIFYKLQKLGYRVSAVVFLYEAAVPLTLPLSWWLSICPIASASPSRRSTSPISSLHCEPCSRWTFRTSTS